MNQLQLVHSKGDQSWVFIGRTDVKAETPILWPPHAKSWPIGKDSDAGRDWGKEEKGMTEDEMAGWHRRLDGHEFEWTLGVGDGQGGLVCCDSWGRKELDTTELLNWTELIHTSPSPTPLRSPTLLDHHRALAELPVLYSSFTLASYFTCGSAYMSMLLSQFVPPFPLPVSTSPFATFASLFLPCKYIHQHHWSGRIITASIKGRRK